MTTLSHSVLDTLGEAAAHHEKGKLFGLLDGARDPVIVPEVMATMVR